MKINYIYQDDCFNRLKKFEDNSVDYTLTSPPYNQKRSIGGGGVKMYREYHDNLTEEEYFTFIDNIISELIRVSKKYVFFNIMYGTNNKSVVFNIIGKYADKIKDMLIWKKPKQPAMCSNVLTHNYEYVFVLGKEKENRKYDIDFGIRGEHTTCFYEFGNSAINKERFDCDGNFAIMSIQIARRIINTFTKEDDIILDPFMGSGTTAVACKEVKRNFVGIELNKKYIDIAYDRINNVKRKPIGLF